MPSALGLLIAIVAWVGVAHVAVWSWNRHVAVLVASGLQVDDADTPLGVGRLARRHTPGWTAAILVFFLLLGLADFPLWQSLGFAGLLSLVYGTNEVAREESERDESEPKGVPLFGRLRDAAWYRLLAVAEWASYLASIVFGAYLLLELVA
jgi:hypothetical protein